MTDEAPKKKLMGRPSKYKPEYCDDVLKLGKEGKSIAQMAAFLDVDKASIYRWVEEHEDFRTALARARAHSQSWWEDKAQLNLGSRDFNAQLWLKNVASRFREDYTERQVTEVSGPDGGAIKFEAKTIDAREMEPEHREALKQILLAAKANSK